MLYYVALFNYWNMTVAYNIEFFVACFMYIEIIIFHKYLFFSSFQDNAY
jgi:hypothetical protein